MRSPNFPSLLLVSALVWPATGSAEPGDRPGWIVPQDALRLVGRDVPMDRTKRLPEPGRAFFVFTSHALTRADLQLAAADGHRYLGVVADHTYAFVRKSTGTSDHRDRFLALAKVRATAAFEPIDRLDANALPMFGLPLDRLPHPLVVTVWGTTTAREAQALLPDALEGRRWPRDLDAPLEEERYFRLPKQTSTGLRLQQLAESAQVASIGLAYPNATFNAASRALSNADALTGAPYGLDGSGVVVGHWDGGRVSTSHQDFSGRVENRENRGVSNHATHTAGTILGDGSGDSDALGFAPGATMIAYDFYGDAAGERRAAKNTYYHEHDNHSWGSTSSSYGAYDGVAQEWDLDSRDLFLLGLKAAGNEGASSQRVDNNYGFDSLPPDSTAKNLLVIGATDDDGDLTGFSSRGPTNDGRVKPDLSGNGQNVYSVMPSGRYGSMSGTSMSTPSVTGMVTLLAQLFKREHANLRWAPDMVRAVMIHTVTDVFQTGPDYRHGWGNADAQAAANLILADVDAPGTRLIRGAVREGEVWEMEMEVPSGAREAKVTTAWLDAYGEGNAQRRLIHDLDLELVSPSGQTFMPWTLDPSNPYTEAVRTERNTQDNAEQVLVDNPEAGTWIVRVTGTSVSHPNLNVQGFVVATSHSVTRTFERVQVDTGPNGLAIPDNDPNGLAITFDVQDGRSIRQLRLRLDIQHPTRGDIRIELIHPDGRQVRLEQDDSSTRRDIYAIYPDTRSYDDDVVSLQGGPGQGVWTAQIIDTGAGDTGVVRQAMLELDLEGPPPPPPNMPPSANAGEDRTVQVDDEVVLDGALSSDPDGDPLGFAWQQQSGTAVTLLTANAQQATFIAPYVKETAVLVFRLTVDDGNGALASDDVSITIEGGQPEGTNRPPIAVVAGDITAPPSTEVVLDASMSSDPDGDPLTFTWRQTEGAVTDLLDTDTAQARFTTPETDGVLVLTFQVEVADDSNQVDLAPITVTVQPGAPPPEMPPPLPEVPIDGVTGAVGGGCGCHAGHPAEGEAPWAALGIVLLGLLARRRRA